MIIDIGKADHVRGGFTGRVETTKLLDAVDTGDFKVEHLLALLGVSPRTR